MISLMVVKSSSVQCIGRQSLIVRRRMLQSKYNGVISVKSLKSSTMDLARFPPSTVYLQEHVAWPNYQTRIWKTAKVPTSEVPKLWEGHP